MKLFPCFYVFGANTDVGKTVVSAGLCRAATMRAMKVAYLKPLQTGFPESSDVDFVSKHAGTDCVSKCFYAWQSPVSPHMAARAGSAATQDATLIRKLKSELEEFAKSHATHSPFALVEGAGGVLSPTAQSTPQADVYRHIRLPVVLVGDSRLGGISSTLSAFESLELRGLDVVAVVFFKSSFVDEQLIQTHLGARCSVLTLPALTADTPDLTTWFVQSNEHFSKLLDVVLRSFQLRVSSLKEAAHTSADVIWWPFTQHQHLSTPLVIDSSFEGHFETYDTHAQNKDELSKHFDASASWWTQTLGHGHAQMSKAVAYAAGRYGHVLFPGHVHEPALKLAQALIKGIGRSFAQKVFYSDNGSTAVEVALKMAFRTRLTRNTHEKAKELFVVGLKDSYHGDTLGAMDASSPNVFKESDLWYAPRGFWFEAPKIKFKNGTYIVSVPREFSPSKPSELQLGSALSDVLELRRQESDLARNYSKYIAEALDKLETAERSAGALLIEPLVHGSAGMHFIDPVFQRCLVKECRARTIPVIFDEVFTGFWRLGFESAADALQVYPDIACYSKALTGGLVPMAVTLASQEVFESFLGDSKVRALLHGHSYTAHPVGCSAALKALELARQSPFLNDKSKCLTEVWNSKIVDALSFLPNVESVTHLGTLLAVELAAENGGYASTAASTVIDTLKHSGIDARPLGNVVYLLATLFEERTALDTIAQKLLDSVNTQQRF